MAVDTARVAGLFASQARMAMIDVLMDGQEHPLGALADAASVTSSTAVGHLVKLESAGLVISRRNGRQRLVRLAGPAVATTVESLSALSARVAPSGLRAWTKHEQLAAARTCYDHLAGRLGVAITDAALAAEALTPDFSLGNGAHAWFSGFGVDLGSLPDGRRPLLRVCVDWTERREHLAGTLGAALRSAVIAAGWVEKRPPARTLSVTVLGRSQFSRLGIPIE